MYYASVVIYATVFSAAWHLEGSQATTKLFALNHAAAALWFFTDVAYTYNTDYFNHVLELNILIATLNPLLSSHYYTYTHSLWNLLSAAKSVYIARNILNR
jgi:hypothetical protein